MLVANTLSWAVSSSSSSGAGAGAGVLTGVRAEERVEIGVDTGGGDGFKAHSPLGAHCKECTLMLVSALAEQDLLWGAGSDPLGRLVTSFKKEWTPRARLVAMLVDSSLREIPFRASCLKKKN